MTERKSPCFFYAPGYHEDALRLQPWRYIHELASFLARRRTVVVATDRQPEPGARLGPIRLVSGGPGEARRALVEAIASFGPGSVWASVTPGSVLEGRFWRGLGLPVTALVTCPLYPWGLLARAQWSGLPLRETRSLWLQRLVPRRLFAAFLSKPFVRRVVVQSSANRRALVEAGLPEARVEMLPVGLDRSEGAAPAPEKLACARGGLGFPEATFVFLYLGAPRRIRGFDALLRAFADAAQQAANARLGILARGADETVCENIRRRCAALGVSDRVRVVGGWLEREQVIAYLDACDAVVLPFVLCPSDVPVAVLEAMARGKAVVSSAVDGIPELLEERGLLVDPLRRDRFATALADLARTPGLAAQLGAKAREFMARYPSWEDVGRLALAGEG